MTGVFFDAMPEPEAVSPKRVLIIAYALSPVLGSEYRSAWELTNRIARDHEVTVLFGDSDGLMGGFSHFDTWCATHTLPFRAVQVAPTLRQASMARRMLHMPLAFFFPALLRQWHRRAFVIAKQLHAEAPFDVVHQLGPIGFRNPGYAWKLGCHSYWGPIGGAQYIDRRMITRKASAYNLEALFRNAATRLQVWSPYIRKAARGFDRVSFATVENADYFARHHGRTGPIISDQGLDLRVAPTTPASGPLQVAWAGTLTPRKNVAALLEVIRAAPRDIIFHVMGTGPYEAEIIALAAERPNLQFHGRLPRREVMAVLDCSDVILLTSLSEANTAILFEGLEHSCIPVTPRINGFVSVLNPEVAFLIEQGDYQVAINRTVEALIALQSPATRDRMRSRLQAHKPELTWDALTQAHERQYA